MHVGILTAPLRTRPLAELIPWAAQQGIRALEIDVRPGTHLDWQGIDVTAAVHEFRDRIFHVHAKDVAVEPTKLARVGYGGDGWWRYVLPGYGRIRWGEFIGTLRDIGYDGVLSIEHEDRAFGYEEGFVKAARYLNALV